METRKFLQIKMLTLAARARRLARIDYKSVGIRPGDIAYAPSARHFQAVNQRLQKIDREVAKRLERVKAIWSSAPQDRVLTDLALVEREVDRARRTFGLFFDIFSQRGSAFAPSLAAHDVIATDCYAAIRQADPQIFPGPLLKPVCYMDHGASPATMRRGILLSRLLGEENLFPLIRIPWDRDNPWQAVFLHEVAHNLQADLGIWQENKQAVLKRMVRSHGMGLTQIYGRWHKEIFADLAALLLGGPAAAWGMAMFLAYPASKTTTYRLGVHPVPYLRIFILAEMLRRMGFKAEASRLKRVWQGLYPANQVRRIPAPLLQTMDRAIPDVVDEIAFQPRRNLAQRALMDIIPFTRHDQLAIEAGAQQLLRGNIPQSLPPRHLVSAASYAVSAGKTDARQLSQLVIDHLANLSRQPSSPAAKRQAASVA